MHSLKHIKIPTSSIIINQIHRLFSTIPKPHFRALSSTTTTTTTRNSKKGGEEWNDAWESAWLPEDLSAKHRAPWETDLNFSEVVDSETKAFVEDMNENWNQRKGSKPKHPETQQNDSNSNSRNGSLYNLENMKKDYRLKKQRIHAGLWTKEIEKEEEAKLGDSMANGGDDIEKLLDSCSEYVFPSISLFVFLFWMSLY
jgi:hypothetical protein